MKLYDLEKEAGFIARHYKRGLFVVDKALKKIKPDSYKWWTIPKIAAASAFIVVLSATAAVLLKETYYSDKEEPEIIKEEIQIQPEMVSKIIDFDDAPLPVVIDRMRMVYGVEITNIPTNADEYHVTLHYEGNAIDLIDTINEIHGIKLEIAK